MNPPWQNPPHGASDYAYISVSRNFIFALRFLKSAIVATGGHQTGPVVIWSIVFLLVTLQMTTSLRPILGRSELFLTQEKKFFLQHWGEWFGKSLQVPLPKTTSTPPVETPAPNSGRNPFNE
jgi:hypothetical protein